jgi:exodeoxyribonuclease VII large subunit
MSDVPVHERFGAAAPYPRLLSVSELTGSIRGLLETSFSFVTVVGEISGLRQAPSGHYYFLLKDEQAQIRAVLFKQQRRYLVKPPADGLAVVCRGRVSVYEPRGEYQLVVDFLEAKGPGELQLAFEHLKKRLREEGLFAQARKRPLPFLPQRIALVTSPTGAAVFDFLRMAGARFPSVPVEIHPVRVQGQGAAEEIVQAISAANDRRTAEVIVLCRGGGSLEDLWAFNEEKVARAIHGSHIPVVSAVGHEIDFTIADFVADFRAPTPTAAAEAVLPVRRELLSRVDDLERRHRCALARMIQQARYRVENQRRLLGDPSFLLTHFLLLLDHKQTGLINAMAGRIKDRRSLLERNYSHLLKHSPLHLLQLQQHLSHELASRLRAAMAHDLERRRLSLAKAAGLIAAVSPLAVLGRGYAIARKLPGLQVVRKAAQVRPGDDIELLLQDGIVRCRVDGVDEKS